MELGLSGLQIWDFIDKCIVIRTLGRIHGNIKFKDERYSRNRLLHRKRSNYRASEKLNVYTVCICAKIK